MTNQGAGPSLTAMGLSEYLCALAHRPPAPPGASWLILPASSRQLPASAGTQWQRHARL